MLIVAHGHILRAFAQRWIGKAVEDGPALIMEAGGIGTLRLVGEGYPPTDEANKVELTIPLSYEHHSIDEPAILLGGAFVVSDTPS